MGPFRRTSLSLLLFLGGLSLVVVSLLWSRSGPSLSPTATPSVLTSSALAGTLQPSTTPTAVPQLTALSEAFAEYVTSHSPLQRAVIDDD